MWVGAFLLIKPLTARALAARASATQTAIGGWLPSAVIGVVQAVFVYAAATLLVGVRPTYGWLTFGVLVATALSFTALLHRLNAKFARSASSSVWCY